MASCPSATREMARAAAGTRAFGHLLLKQLAALRDRRGVARRRVLQALRVLLDLSRARVAAARAAAPARPAGAARAAEPAGQPAELLLELRDRPGVRRRRDLLRLADLREVDREVERAALGALELRALVGRDLEVDRHREPADLVVVLADVDVELRVLHDFLDLLDRVGRELLRSGRAHRPRLLDRLVEVAEHA